VGEAASLPAPTVLYASGNFVVLWDSTTQDGSARGVFGQRFLADLIFKDDFEAGTLAAWSASTTDGGDLSDSNCLC